MSRPVMLRGMGLSIVAAGVGWLLVGVLAVAGVALSSGTVLILLALTLVVVGASAARVQWPPRLLELTAEGYRVRVRGGGGVRAAGWREVETVELRQGRGGSFVTMRLTDGRHSIVPCRLLGDRAVDAQRDIHDRLNVAHGYRRLDGA